MILNNFYSEHFFPYVQEIGPGTILHLWYALIAAILNKNGYNSWFIKARCMQVVLIESPRDFEQLFFQAFFSYLFKKYGQGQFYIGNMRLWWPSWKMAITFEPLTLEACNWHWQKAFIILNNFYTRHFSSISSRNRVTDIFTFLHLYYALMAAILKMAAMSAIGPIRDGSISKSVHNILVYLCAKFGAFMKNCTIGLLICPTIRSIVRQLIDCI